MASTSDDEADLDLLSRSLFFEGLRYWKASVDCGGANLPAEHEVIRWYGTTGPR